jgi:vancomycin permeability regulator SanA
MQSSQQIAIVGAGIEGLHLVGDYYGHSTIETVVRSARSATDELLARPIPSENR